MARDRRPRSEEPLAIADSRSALISTLGMVPEKSFLWVDGIQGTTELPDRFLRANPGKWKHVETDQELYLKFAEVEGTDQSALLDFANKHGSLGVPDMHFHSSKTTRVWGQSLSIWQQCWEEFQKAFDLWQTLSEGDVRKAKALMTLHPQEPGVVSPFIPEVHVCSADEPSFSRDPLTVAKRVVVLWVNRHLMPQRYVNTGRCYLAGCAELKFFNRSRPNPWVQYQLAIQQAGKAVNVVPRVKPTSLLAAIWLQFAEYIAGSRQIRRCEECLQYMDITDCARPGAKRIHERCSHAARVRRWRRAKKQAQPREGY